MIITVANQKGGAGKTNLCMQLAGALARKKAIKVLVVDADPQGTATRWAAAAAEETPFPAAVMGLAAANGKLHQEVRKFINDYDYILVDCPPSVESLAAQSALMISDLVLVPIIPSPGDLWAGVGIKRLIENVAVTNESLKARLVANMSNGKATLTRALLTNLEDFGIPMLKTQLGNRIAYRECVAMGTSVHTLGAPAAKAINEIDALTREVLKVLKETNNV